MELGVRIRQARSKVGMSIRDLAARLGVSHAAVGHWETGTHRPSITTLLSVAEITGADIGWLISGVTPLKVVRELSEDEKERVGGGFRGFELLVGYPGMIVAMR